MSELSFSANGREQKDRLVALLCLGVLEAIRADVMDFDEAGLQLLWPAVWREIQNAGCSPRVLSVLAMAAELEDIQDVSPHTFGESLERVKQKIYTILRGSSLPGHEDSQGWLQLGHTRSVEHDKSPQRIIGAQWLNQMSPWEFEQLIANLLEGLGYLPTPVSSRSDMGIDFIAIKDGVRYGIQLKHYKQRKVGAEALHALMLALERNELARGLLITSTTFTDDARQIAASTDIELWDRETVVAKLDGTLTST